MAENNVTERTARLLSAIWRNWAIAVGALTFPLLLAIFVPKIWIPFVCLAEGYLLVSLMRANLNSGVSSCSLIVRVSSRILLLTAAVMFVVVILCTDWLVPTVIHLDLYNSEIPFVTCLVVFPVTAVFCVLSLFFGMGQRHCRECQRRNGFYAGDSLVATLYYRESKYQTGILLVLALTLGGVEYWYYFARYINSDMNAPDRFFFNIMPVAMYLLSLFFMGGRYISMQNLYKALEDATAGRSDKTVVRYMIISDGDLLLHSGRDGRWDTPAECVVGRCRSIGEPQARLMLTEQTGITDFVLRYCFTNEGFAEGSNIIHYAAFVDSSHRDAAAGEDVWFNPYMIDAALAANALSPLLANELFRIHTMTMAWKTYDRDGNRLYPIKHYRPTFRLQDMQQWTVDYDDCRWFDVASNNEDRLFFRTRRAWHRMTDVFRPKSTARNHD